MGPIVCRNPMGQISRSSTSWECHDVLKCEELTEWWPVWIQWDQAITEHSIESVIWQQVKEVFEKHSAHKIHFVELELNCSDALFPKKIDGSLEHLQFVPLCVNFQKMNKGNAVIGSEGIEVDHIDQMLFRLPLVNPLNNPRMQ